MDPNQQYQQQKPVGLYVVIAILAVAVIVLVTVLITKTLDEKKSNTPDTTTVAATTTEEVLTPPDTQATTEAATTEATTQAQTATAYDQEEAYAAFEQFLTEAKSNGKIAVDKNNKPFEITAFDYGEDVGPDGHYIFTDYATCDVDGDGKKELLVRYTDSPMAAMACYVIDYTPDRGLYLEANFFPAETYYRDWISVGVSHNQGVAGSFWPYTMYRYVEDEDCYEPMFFVDAWDGNIFETDYDGNAFPAADDKDGDKIIYYVKSFVGDQTDWNTVTEFTFDKNELDEWHSQYVDERTMVIPDWKPLGNGVIEFD